MKTDFMELIKINPNKYELEFEGDIYTVYYSSKNTYNENALDAECSIYCDFNSDDEVPFGKFTELRGADIIENLELLIKYITIDFYDICKQLEIEFIYMKLAHKNGKLLILNGFSFQWESWNENIDLKSYAALLSKKLNMQSDIQICQTFIEDSSQWVQFIFEFDANKSIIECIKEINLILIEIHDEIFKAYRDENDFTSIKRCLEFEPQYYQAGLGILNYFGTIVREKYPDKNCKVKIEQNGYSVAMTIETEDGDKEVIEQLLQDYHLVVIGDMPIESLLDTSVQALELKFELMSAQTKIDMQKELLLFKDRELMNLKDLFKHALTQNTIHTHNINMSPNIVIDAKQSIETSIINNISEVLTPLDNILNMCDDKVLRAHMKDLHDEIQNMEKIQDKDSIKKSSGLNKMKEFIEDANKTGTPLNSFFQTVSQGYENLKVIAKKYNAIAEWCGAPQVPTVFL